MSLEEYIRDLQEPEYPLELTVANLCILVRKHRKLNNLTQEELGQKLGVHGSQIAKIEKGQKDLRLSTFVKVLRVLDLKVLITVEKK